VTPTLIAGVGTAVAAVPILGYTLLSQKKTSGKSSINASELVGKKKGDALDLRSQILAKSAKDRAIAPQIQKLLKLMRRLTPSGWSEQMEQRIAMAGLNQKWSAERVLVLKAIGLVIGGLYALKNLGGGVDGLVGILKVAAPAPLGFFLPDILIKNNADKRQKEIQKQLPDFLDQITVGVEAGLGLDAAMSRTAKSNGGPLAEEFRRTLQHVQAGLSRGEALRGLANRNKVVELRQFVASILQAEQFGIPMAQVLRVQAAEQRRKRRQRAEEKAMKLPVKVLFPLILCILPALFVVLIGPAALNIMDANLAGD
jgi:tight adherence protein C